MASKKLGRTNVRALLPILGLAGALLSGSAHSQACACGVPGLDTALTLPTDSWGTRMTESARFGHGRYDARGDYTAFEDDEYERRYELSALVAVRPIARLELSGVFAYLRDTQQAAAGSWSLSGFGDVLVRARFEPIDETPRDSARFPWPALAMSSSVRAPTAAGNGSTSLGLGAWELMQGLWLERSLTRSLRLGFMAEVGVRAADTSLGVDRRLGPRVSTQLTAWYWPVPDVALSFSSGLLWEGEVELSGERQPGSGTRQGLLGAGVVYGPSGSGIRPAAAVRFAPAIAGLVVNAPTSATIEVSLAYTR
jgi:hypothetical protein